jgi:hypothetical protein
MRSGERDDDAGNDGRIQAVLGRHTDRDGEGHRQRQRDDADHEPGQRVCTKRGAVVPLRERLLEGRADRQFARRGELRREEREDGPAAGRMWMWRQGNGYLEAMPVPLAKTPNFSAMPQTHARNSCATS